MLGQVHLDGVNPVPVEVLEIAAGYLHEEVSQVKIRAVHTQLCALFVHTVDNQRHYEIQRVAVSESSRHIDVATCINQRSGVSLTIVTPSVLDHVVDVDVVVLTTNLGLDVEIGQLLLVGHATMVSNYILTAHGVDVELSGVTRPKKITYLGVDTTYR